MATAPHRVVRVHREGAPDIDLVLSKVTALRRGVPRKVIELEELKDGTWRLIYSEDVIDDISKLLSLEIIRGG